MRPRRRSPAQLGIAYSRPKTLRKLKPKQLSAPKLSPLRLAMHLLSKAPLVAPRPGKEVRKPALVLPFHLTSPARVSISFVSRKDQVLGKFFVRGKRGLNHITLPANLSRSLLKGKAGLIVKTRDPSGKDISVIFDTPDQVEPSFIHPGATARLLGHFESGIVGVAGYWAANDGWEHVIVATQDGKVTELFFNPNDPNPSLRGYVGQTQLMRWPSGSLLGVAAYYAHSDDFDHVFVAVAGPAASTVWEVQWNPSRPSNYLDIDFLMGRPNRKAWGELVPSIDAIAAFEAPNMGWIAGWPNAPGIYRQYLLVSGPSRDGDTLFFLPPFFSDKNVRTILPFTTVLTYDVPPSPAAFYSLSQNSLTFVGIGQFGPVQVGNQWKMVNRIFGEFIPLDRWKGSNGDVEIGKWYHGAPFPLPPDVGPDGKIAAFWPDEILFTGSASPGDIFERRPDPESLDKTCDARFDAGFYPGPQLDYPTVSWCSNRLAHFDEGIVALAGYFRPLTWQGPGANHAIVATDQGDVFDIAFRPDVAREVVSG